MICWDCFAKSDILQLVQYLDEYVIGQENAKKVLSVAYVQFHTIDFNRSHWWYCRVFNHYNRVRANLSAIEAEQEEHSWSELNSDDGKTLRSR